MLEWTASVRIATEPGDRCPAITLSRISAELEATDSVAVRRCSSWTGGCAEAGSGERADVGTEALTARTIPATPRAPAPHARGG